jgi:aminoglycoside 3-N-acetyltransferase
MTPAYSTLVSDRRTLAADLAELGLPAGRDVLIHCSMRRIGHITGGPATLLNAVQDVVGPAATVVVPTQTAHNSTTSPFFQYATRGMDAAAVADFEATMEGFDPDRSPSYGMGAFAEHVRRQHGAVRSAHPQTSFAAIGPNAVALMAVHDLDSHLGERSPLAALYASNAVTLLLGVGYESCTTLHLAEYRLPRPVPTRPYTCYVNVDGKRVRCEFLAADLDDGPFLKLGAALDQEPYVASGRVGEATARIIPIRNTVDFAIGWMAHQSQPIFMN